MNKFLRVATICLWGGFLYYLAEIAWRGYSHPSMYILGGICFLQLGKINDFLSWDLGLIWQALIGAVCVTFMELLGGLVINVWLGLGVWDYSDKPFNFLGQICLSQSFLWIPLSAMAVVLADYLNHYLFGDRKPRYTWIKIPRRESYG
jgi:uncharacterized membrane protein